jgi:hypothetical protein
MKVAMVKRLQQYLFLLGTHNLLSKLQTKHTQTQIHANTVRFLVPLFCSKAKSWCPVWNLTCVSHVTHTEALQAIDWCLQHTTTSVSTLTPIWYAFNLEATATHHPENKAAAILTYSE